MEPCWYFAIPEIALSRVDFPAPLFPTTASISPFLRQTDISMVKDHLYNTGSIRLQLKMVLLSGLLSANDPPDIWRPLISEFYCIFQYGNLSSSLISAPRASHLHVKRLSQAVFRQNVFPRSLSGLSSKTILPSSMTTTRSNPCSNTSSILCSITRMVFPVLA